MAQALKRGRIFYGWWIVVVGILVTMLHAGAAFYAFSRFLPTLLDEFQSGATLIAGAASLYMLVVGFTGPVAGKLTDRWGPKKPIVIGAAIAAAGLMLLGAATAVWQLYVFYFIVGIGMSGAGFVPVGVAVANWFERRRGVAMGITMAGVALGGIVIAPLAHYLIVWTGWRMAFVILGAMTAVLVIIPTMLVLRTRPEDMGLLPDGARAPEGEAVPAAAGASEPASAGGASNVNEEHWTLSMAFRTPRFWLLLATFFFAGAVVAGVLQHEVNILKDMGIPLAAASFALGLTGGIGGVGKVFFGFIGDRFTPRYASLLCIGLQIVGLVILMLTHSMAMVWVFVFVYGFAMGGWLTLEPLMTGELFGMASFGTIFGWVLAAAAVGSGLGPIIMGAVYDASGTYFVGMIIFLGAYGVSMTSLLLARRPKRATVDTAA
jgi:MFS family permease